MAARRLARTARQLTLRPDATLRLVVVADTHSQPHPRAAEYLAACAPDAILHAGDIGDLGVLEQLSGIAPVLAIRGNIDVHAPDLPDVLTLDLVRGAEDPQPLLRMLLVHIGVHGPKLRAEVAAMAWVGSIAARPDAAATGDSFDELSATTLSPLCRPARGWPNAVGF